MPSVLWHCWLGGRKGIRPVKNWVVGCWHGYLSGVRCRLAYGPAQLMPLPLTVSCFSKIQIGFTFLVQAHLASPGQRVVKREREAQFNKRSTYWIRITQSCDYTDNAVMHRRIQAVIGVHSGCVARVVDRSNHGCTPTLLQQAPLSKTATAAAA